jgi:putative endonuclease
MIGDLNCPPTRSFPRKRESRNGWAMRKPVIVVNQNVAVAKPFYVYIMASGRNGTLYLGMTDNLAARILQHRDGVTKGFTSRYYIKLLVWFEPHSSRQDAFTRERQMKKWNRAWKMERIEKMNPGWNDLYETLRL